MRWLASFFLATILIAYTATGVPNPKFPWPDEGGGGSGILFVSATTGAIGGSGHCSSILGTPGSGGCANMHRSIRAPFAMTVTSVGIVVGVSGWAANEGCDVFLELASTPVAATELLIGEDAGVDDPGEFGSTTGLSVAVAAGTLIGITHETPSAGDDVCVGTNADYIYHVIGTVDP